MPEELLAERELLGYPGAKVELHADLSISPANVRVLVRDELGETELPGDAFFHPFAYGYVYPERAEADD